MRCLILWLCLSTTALAADAGVLRSPLDLIDDANKAYEKKAFSQCAALYLEVAGRPGPKKADFLYNAACCQALAGDKAAAFATLDQAVAAGLEDGAAATADADLAALRSDPRWAPLMAKLTAKREATLKTLNGELLQLFEADQADRADPMKVNWAEVAPRDAKRRERVRAILAAKGAKVAADYYHAALVLQHGEKVADFQEANALAQEAVKRDPQYPKARWLVAATKDRELMTLKKPQRYGTQFRREGNKWVLYEVDPSVTDEERAKWDVPSLAEAERKLAGMNAAQP